MGCNESVPVYEIPDEIKGHKTRTKQASTQRSFCGLRNIGNTCFLNAPLQCLFHTPPLNEYFLQGEWEEDINEENPLGHKGDLARVFSTLLENVGAARKGQKKVTIDPTTFKKKLDSFAGQFAGGGQQDAHELLAFVLDGLHEDLNRVTKKPYIQEFPVPACKPHAIAGAESWHNHLRRNRSIIVDIFQGQLRSTIQCCGCKYKNVKFEPFMFLSLPIEKDQDGNASLESCLELFCKEEKLEGDECWFCPACNKMTEATKKFDLWKTPPILVVHMKRFRQHKDGRMSKIKDSVAFPVTNFAIDGFVQGPQKQRLGQKRGNGKSASAYEYDLYSVIRHSGGLSNGHYTALAREATSDHWYEMDDSNYRRVPVDKVVDNTAYCCFYAKMVSNRSKQNAGANAGAPGKATSAGTEDNKENRSNRNS